MRVCNSGEDHHIIYNIVRGSTESGCQGNCQWKSCGLTYGGGEELRAVTSALFWSSFFALPPTPNLIHDSINVQGGDGKKKRQSLSGHAFFFTHSHSSHTTVRTKSTDGSL